MDHVEPEESFMWDAYVEEVLGQENACTSIKQWGGGLDAKYEKLDLIKVTKNQFKNLPEDQQKKLLRLLLNFEDLFNGTIGTWEMELVELE